MVTINPVIRLDTKESFDVLKAVPLDFIAVRFQDLVSKKSFEFNKLFFDIVYSGGIHKFLKFQGEIMLSLIMKDQIIANTQPKQYAFAINSLGVDSFTTIDGETYEGELTVASKEITRIQQENEELLSYVKHAKPIGLVKGCTTKQIEEHQSMLLELGIDEFIFHIGDYFKKGNEEMIKKGREFANLIHKRGKTLILYGFGSQNRLLEFSFADRYVTFNHFVMAKNGFRYAGTKYSKYCGNLMSEIVTENFIQMAQNVKSLRTQTTLNQVRA